MATAREPCLYLAYDAEVNEWGGGVRVNGLCAQALRRTFRMARGVDDADLQVHSFSWDAPPEPRRLFIDHGSFADASFWAYLAPKLRRRDTILVSSAVCRAVAKRFFGDDGPLVDVVPFPVDTDLFAPAEDRTAARRAVAERFDLPRSGPLLLVVAGFTRRKNHHLALQLFRRLLDRMPEAHLVLVGATPQRASNLAYREAVFEMAKNEGFLDRVRFVESLPQTRLAELMAGADLLLHLSNCRLENFGLVVAEALASGLPVLAADWGGLRDLVRHGRTGWRAATLLTRGGPRTDWLSLVPRMIEILQDPALHRVLSAAGRRFALEHLNSGLHHDRLVRAVRRALDRDGASDEGVRFTGPATELRMRTIALNAVHPEIRSVGDEFRLLMETEEGAHYRFLAGPAASLEKPPALDAETRLYQSAESQLRGGVLHVTDPAWPAVHALDAAQSGILKLSDGTRSLRDIEAAIDPVLRSRLPEVARSLVEAGILSPRLDHLIESAPDD